MRKIRGVKNLVDYLKSIDCPISESTLYRLVRKKEIPFNRPSPGVLLFDLNKIDEWLSGEENLA
ncbi:helix-turn-helix domain-containing protein [Psychrobacillus sp.]|uniref:helix-turn-helix transcriptional regulator n=1 Tax=Psychrobacillus sp. TaxID=1871623 RepID=UPI0028BF262E|nr:helix-turn-helix domain-containing protein [Psychrobacillus sp.]